MSTADALIRLNDRIESAYRRGDVSTMDELYLEMGDRPMGSGLSRKYRLDHVARLCDQGRHLLALRRCVDYLTRHGDDAELRLLRAEVLGSMGRYETVDVQRDLLSGDSQARLSRLEGLAAVDRGDQDAATDLLGEARRGFLSIEDSTAVAHVDADQQAAAAWHDGTEPLANDSPLARFRLAGSYRNAQRYEEALDVLRELATSELEPWLRAHVLFEQLVLLGLIRRPDKAQLLLPEVARAVTTAGDPALTDALGVLDTNGPTTTVLRFDRALQLTRKHIADGELEAAQNILSTLQERATTARDISTWHLVSGELLLARPNGSTETVRAALDHLDTAIENATATPLTEIRARALLLSGTAQYRLHDVRSATTRWHSSHAIEEQIAERQVTDEVRVNMLASSSDEYDMMIGAAAEAGRRPDAAAGVVVALEQARGTTLLSRLLTEQSRSGYARNLPSPTDLPAARQWVHEAVETLPPDQAFWLIHPAADSTHHALVGHSLLQHVAVPTDRPTLEATVNVLSAWCSHPEILQGSIHTGAFNRTLSEIATLVGVGAVLAHCPTTVTRLAVVASGALADIPFSAMSLDDSPTLVGHRFALSHLPSLSARRLLRHRSAGQRGNRVLLVRSPDANLAEARGVPRRRRLDASVAAMRARVATGRDRIVQIDTHGSYDEEHPDSSWLQFADGRLTPNLVQDMDFHGCGLLVLGACESGMAEPRGRDERTGFVRAAMLAGTASVVATRWDAHDAIGAAILDRFRRYLRYLPRDVALQRAQLDMCDGGMPVGVEFHRHPAMWACWALYGDSGYQTRRGPRARLLREKIDRWRHHAR